MDTQDVRKARSVQAGTVTFLFREALYSSMIRVDLEMVDSIDTDRIRSENGKIIIDLPEDVYDAYNLYMEQPLVKLFVKRELYSMQKKVYDAEPRDSYFAVKGILSELDSGEYIFDPDEFSYMQEQINGLLNNDI